VNLEANDGLIGRHQFPVSSCQFKVE
jgi:hypothetical protein